LLVKPDPQRPKAPPYATLKLPYPKRITSLRVVSVPNKYFKNAHALVVKTDPQHIGTLQVFTYEIEDEKKLSLKGDPGEGHYWEPAFTGNHINLHIFCSEDHYYKPSNASYDFDGCVKLLGADLTLDASSLPATRILENGHLPEGVVPQETEGLAIRTLRMARLGRLVVQDGDTNMAWHGNDALDGDPEACGPVFDAT
jgi:hypothetical protein